MRRTRQLVIDQPTIEDGPGATVWSSAISGHPLGSRLEFRIDSDYEQMLTRSAESAVLAMLVPALEVGADLAVEGTLDPEFLVTVRDEILPLYARFLGVDRVGLEAQTVESATGRTRGGLTGFTGGVDSFSTVVRSVSEPASSPYALSHLVFSSIGGGGVEELRTYHAHFDRVKPLAEAFELPLIRVESNMGLFFEDKRYVKNHTPRNVAVGLLFQDGIKHFHYSTGYSYWESSLTSRSDIAHLDPVAVPGMSTSATRTHAAMGYLTRFERTEMLVDCGPAQRGLHVCQRSDSSSGNCSSCKKCVRTMCSLDVLGSLPKFDAVFDLTDWASRRRRGWAMLLANNDEFGAELLRQAQLRDFPVPQGAQLAARMPRPLRRLARGRLRGSS